MLRKHRCWVKKKKANKTIRLQLKCLILTLLSLVSMGLIICIRDVGLVSKKRNNTNLVYSRRESIVLKCKQVDGK